MNVFWRAASSAACSCRRPEAAGRARDCSRPGPRALPRLLPDRRSIALQFELAAFRDDRPRRFDQIVDAFAGHRRDLEELQLQLLRALLERGDALRIVERVDLVGGHQLRLLEQLRVVELELAADGVEVLDRVASRRAGDVDQVNQHLGALDVAQELMAEAVAFVRAFDQAGHIGDHEAAIVAQRDHAEVRRERGERVIGNLRFRRRHHRDQRGLAGVGKSDQADIREQLQRQVQIEFFTGLARLHLARRAIGRRREVRVAQPAASAFGQQHALADGGEVGDLRRARRSRDPSRRSACRPEPGCRDPCRRVRSAARRRRCRRAGALYSGLNWK